MVTRKETDALDCLVIEFEGGLSEDYQTADARYCSKFDIQKAGFTQFLKTIFAICEVESYPDKINGQCYSVAALPTVSTHHGELTLRQRLLEDNSGDQHIELMLCDDRCYATSEVAIGGLREVSANAQLWTPCGEVTTQTQLDRLIVLTNKVLRTTSIKNCGYAAPAVAVWG